MHDRPGAVPRTLYRLMTAAVLLFFCPATARAVIGGTHHDMQKYFISERGPCQYCHPPHKAGTERYLLSKDPPDNGLGIIGNFCYAACHDGTTLAGTQVVAPDGTFGLRALQRSHGLMISRIARSGIENEENVAVSGLVKKNVLVMGCDACHEVHGSDYPPFLVADMSELCQRCHSGRDRYGKGRYSLITGRGKLLAGGHTIMAGYPEPTRGERHRGAMSFKPVASALSVPTRSRDDLLDPLVHWDTGGHLAASEGGSQSVVICSTCHSAHSTRKNLLVMEAGLPDELASPLCEGCHVTPENRHANPGTTLYYHPVFEESIRPYATSVFPHWPLPIIVPRGWPVGRDGGLLCTTCHTPHDASEGTKNLRKNPGGRKIFCESCHVTVDDLGSAANSHHATGNEDYTMSESGGYKNPSWCAGPGSPGDLADGLSCFDCHVELAKSAHNW